MPTQLPSVSKYNQHAHHPDMARALASKKAIKWPFYGFYSFFISRFSLSLPSSHDNGRKKKQKYLKKCVMCVCVDSEPDSGIKIT
jgi:hypothetical protein